MNNQERKEILSMIHTGSADDVLSLLSEQLSLSELNTLLLEVFRKRTETTSPSELLKRYAANRFVGPAEVNPIQLKKVELRTLEIAEAALYIPIQLSPVAPLGACSTVAAVDQNNMISALRGTEVVADATNVLALHICHSIKSGKWPNREELVRFCTTHRHVRAQHYNKPGLSSHFHLFCMVASGKDTGSYGFEKQAFIEHLHVYQSIFTSLFDTNIMVKVSGRSGYTDGEGLIRRIIEYAENHLPDVTVIRSEHSDQANNQYYKGLQFSILVTINGKELTIGDGGFVDWSQKLLGNQKERMMISAIGLERLLI